MTKNLQEIEFQSSEHSKSTGTICTKREAFENGKRYGYAEGITGIQLIPFEENLNYTIEFRVGRAVAFGYTAANRDNRPWAAAISAGCWATISEINPEAVVRYFDESDGLYFLKIWVECDVENARRANLPSSTTRKLRRDM